MSSFRLRASQRRLSSIYLLNVKLPLQKHTQQSRGPVVHVGKKEESFCVTPDSGSGGCTLSSLVCAGATASSLLGPSKDSVHRSVWSCNGKQEKPWTCGQQTEFKSKLSLKGYAELPQPSSSPRSPPSCSFSLAFLSRFHCPCALCNATRSSSVLGHLFHPCFCKIFHLGVFQVPMVSLAPLRLKIPMMAV